ncbi:ATP-binding cassette domain-containing protein [Ferrimonas balearica]|uniref:ATP-binding cassette domain-containing protein n=1 Tax=Ferrimonas balearica TaxID=44012 RepID=UPI001C9909CC|nr:ATP-binding cassette domain-containing protein [Ferrimonas balearica]MBY5993052.1 ATP-binding cassette domain-containing protein [Ferrimonas balearica]
MITLDKVQLIRGGKRLLDDASLTLFPGHKVALVGANGVGKSSLLGLLMGEFGVDAGECQVPGQWRQASVAQDTPALACSALDYVLDGDQRYRALEQELGDAQSSGDGARIGHAHDAFEAYHGYQVPARAAELLDGLGFSQHAQGQSVKSFSGGWRMRLNLARALLIPSDLLLLDEPTNHLDLDTLIWLEGWLKRYDGTLILISHDRDFLDAVVGEVVHVTQQQLHHYPGNYSQFERVRAERQAQQQAQYDKQQREKAHMQSFVDRFRAKASKARQAQSRLKALEKLTLVAPAHADSGFEMAFRDPLALPSPLLRMEQVQGGYGDTTILSRIQLNLVPGSRIGLLGRNGAGKSTLIKLLSGELAPQAGELLMSQGVKIGYFAQHQLESLDPRHSALDHLVRLAPEAKEQELRNYLGGYGFGGDKALSPVAPFSGGEKARLVLALLVWQRPNLLLLDEPTNHLDLEMRHALTVALQGFEGAMVIVSHDRHLLRATCSDFYLVDGGRVEPFAGDLEDYHRWLLRGDDTAPATSAPRPQDDRKARKRAEAELRQKLSPLKKQQEKVDKALTGAQERWEYLENQLSDSNLYNDDNKAQLTDLLKERGDLQNRIETLEMEWLDLQDQMEQLSEAHQEQ